jgi:hypothetical protein
MKLVLLAGLCIACLGALSWFRGYRISMVCVGTQCADAGFPWSASGSILLLVASTILAAVLLAKLWSRWGILLLGLGLTTIVSAAVFCQEPE